jgi:hypothetical protein
MDKEKINEAIGKLKALQSDDILKQLMDQIVGFIGELIVIEKLIEEGMDPKHIGGKKKYDIECNGKRIEVRTSSSRSQKDESKVWGWNLRKINQKESNCSHIICIQLDDKLDATKYLIIKSEDVKHFPESKTKYDLIISDNKSKFNKYQDAITNYVTWIDKSDPLSTVLGLTAER